MNEDISGSQGVATIRFSAGREIKQLTGLRGIAALDVVIGHYNIHASSLLRLVSFGNVAVDLFFCLSSFTLCLVYGAGLRQALNLRHYGVARLARIYPLYLLVFAVNAMLAFEWGWSNVHLYSKAGALLDGLRQVLLINAWPVLGSGVFWDVTQWSVSVEVFCYIAAFPPFFYLTHRVARAGASMRAGVALVLCFLNLLAFKKAFTPVICTFGYPAAPDIAYWVALIRGLTMFGAGWLAYISWLRQDDWAKGAAGIADAVALAVLSIVVGFGFRLLDGPLMVLLFPSFLLALMNGRSNVSRLLSTRPVLFLGRISYALYLVHLPVHAALWAYWPTVMNNETMRIPVALVTSLLVATVSLYALEVPARRALRSWLADGRGAVQASLAPISGGDGVAAEALERVSV